MKNINTTAKWIGTALLAVGILLLIVYFSIPREKVETDLTSNESMTEVSTSTSEVVSNEPIVKTPTKPVQKNQPVSLKVVKVEKLCDDPVLCKAPVISKLFTRNVTRSGVVIVWETDQLATTELSFNEYVQFSQTKAWNVSSPYLSKIHEIDLNSLKPRTTYNLVVKSTNSAGFTATSSIISITTLD